MKLWVDDERPKPEYFDVWAKTADEAIRILGLGGVTEISLDHDLGGDKPGETGYAVAVWIEHAAANRRLKKIKWAVHSANPPGRRNIEAAMQKADEFWEENPPIMRFLGEYNYLSNFHMAEVEYEGVMYPSTEHAFQAAKTMDPDLRNRVRGASTPGQAKYIGRHRIECRPDWEAIKDRVMEEVVLDKFTRHPQLREKLLSTGDRELVEGNAHGDKIWGMVKNELGVWEGENRLGKILMKIRKQLREAP